MSKIESGTIFQFTIPNNLGVGYCKVIDFTNLSQFFGVVVKIYDFFEEIKVGEIEIFKDMDLFMNPILISKMPTIKGKYSWKKIGVFTELSDRDIPIYKSPIEDGFAWDTIEEYQMRSWNAVIDFSRKLGNLRFEQVRHLEEVFLRSTINVEYRVAMEVLRNQNINLKRFFKSEVENDAWKADFNTQQFIPLYKMIPREIRGRPLIKGWVDEKYLDFNWDSLSV